MKMWHFVQNTTNNPVPSSASRPNYIIKSPASNTIFATHSAINVSLVRPWCYAKELHLDSGLFSPCSFSQWKIYYINTSWKEQKKSTIKVLNIPTFEVKLLIEGTKWKQSYRRRVPSNLGKTQIHAQAGSWIIGGYIPSTNKLAVSQQLLEWV